MTIPPLAAEGTVVMDLDRRIGTGLATPVLSAGAGVSASTSFAGLAKTLEGRLPDHAGAGETRELDFRDQFGLQPMRSRLFARRILAPERVCLRSGGLELWHQNRDFLGPVAGPDITDVDE